MVQIGQYPLEYDPKIHGPYDPARFYGKPDTPFGQVKLSELGSWLARRNKSPQAITSAISRGKEFPIPKTKSTTCWNRESVQLLFTSKCGQIHGRFCNCFHPWPTLYWVFQEEMYKIQYIKNLAEENMSPNDIFYQGTYWRWQHKYVLPKRAGIAPFLHIVFGAMGVFYFLNYGKLSRHRNYKYH